MRCAARHSAGFTLLELLISLALATLLLIGISGIVKNATGTDTLIEERNQLWRDTQFALQRMTHAISETHFLLLPQPDNPNTNWREFVREETVPPSAPEGSSTKATAVLAVALSASVDLDADGFADADNDRDGIIDEDYPADITNDSASGVYLIDDGGDGSVDESTAVNDDDESQDAADEDPHDGVDDDGDGVVDEDPGADMNGDGAAGVVGVDDDGDGLVDESSVADDDEDGSTDEDWLDAVVFYLQGNSLVERHPVPWDETLDGNIDGRDYSIAVIAENVTRFRVERLTMTGGTTLLVSIELDVTGPRGESVSATTRVRVGGAR